MILNILLFLAFCAGVFYLASWVYPILSKKHKRWEEKRIDKIAPKFEGIYMFLPRKKLILLDTLSPVVCGAAAFVLTKSLLLAVVAAAVGLSIPVLVLKQMEETRRRKFSEQLVDALMILSSSLKAGLSIVQAFEVIVEEMPPPISQEFSLVGRQLKMGVGLEETLNKMKKRMRSEDLDLIVSAMMVARETGGNLPDTFAQITSTIKERNKLISKVNALCVQGKLQGIIMSFIPIGFAAFVYQTNPEFFSIFLTDRLGRMLIGYAVVSEILGIFFIRKLSRIEI